MGLRKIAGALTVSVGVIAGSLVAVPPSVAAVASPYDDEIGNQLALASASLAQASLLPDLLPAIPGLEANPNNRQSPFLFRELVAAHLKQAAGADASCVIPTLASADAWLAANPPDSEVKKNSSAWTSEPEPWFEQLVAYNAGLLCAPAN